MSGYLKLIVLFAAGVAVGSFYARRVADSPPWPSGEYTQLEGAKQRLTELTERELEEYHALKDLKARYEKADELLGKMILVLIADLGLKVSDKHKVMAEASAKGRPQAAEPATAPGPGLQPERQPEARGPDVRPSEPRDPGPQPSVVTASTPPGTPKLAGYVPFDRMEMRSRRDCRKNPPGWYIAGDNPQDYRIGLEPSTASSGDPVATIEAVVPNPRPHAELGHCTDLAQIMGKRIRFTASVKAQGVRDYANVHLRAENQNRERISDRRTTVRGDFDWKPFVLELDVPPEATMVTYGIVFESVGKIWIRHATLQIVGPSTGQPPGER